jgi:ABC-type multidrug transport system fused ATPase/permease subunit
MVSTVIKTAYSYIRRTPYYPLFVASYVTLITINFLDSWFLARMGTADEKTLMTIVFWYMGVNLVNAVSNNYSQRFREETIAQMEGLFRRDAYAKYDSLSFQSKNKYEARSFRTKLYSATMGLNSIISWGLMQTIFLISSIFGCFTVFYMNDMLNLLFILVLLNAVTYYFYLGGVQQKFSETGKKNREAREERGSILTLFLPLFQYKQKSMEDLLSLEQKNSREKVEQNKMWCHISNTTSTINTVGLALICYATTDNKARLLLLIYSFGDFKGAVSSTMNFMNQYRMFENEYATYESSWNEMTFQQPPTELPLPRQFQITNLSVLRNRFTLGFNSNLPSLTVAQGDRILITGASGDGKTTFINALMGKIAGMRLDYGNPENFFHHFEEVYQKIKETLPTTKITIRQLFDNETDESSIMRCCRLCGLEEWVTKLGTVQDEKKNEVKVDIGNSLDFKLDESISGGEKTRLAIATRLHQLITKKKPIFVLDEPESGSDPPLAYAILKNILDAFPLTTIIIISHLERIKTEFRWNTKLKMCRGVVSLDN